MGETAIVIARGGSKRIPWKNLLPIEEKPLIWWQVRHILSGKLIDKVYLSTDDEEIARVGADAGAIIIQRPTWPDAYPGNVPFCHAIETLNAMGEGRDTYVMFLGACCLWKMDEVLKGWMYCEMYENEYQVSPAVRRNDLVLWEVNHRGLLDMYLFDNKPGRFAMTPGSGWVVMPTKLYLDFNYMGKGSCQVLTDDCEWISQPGHALTAMVPVWVEQWQVFDLDFPRDIEVVEYFFKKHVMGEIDA